MKSIDIDNIANMNYLEKAVLPFKKLRYQRQNNGIRKNLEALFNQFVDK